MREVILELKEHLKINKKYQRLYRAFRTLPQFNLPLIDLKKEVESLHKLRTVRSLNPNSVDFADKLIKANLIDQSYRSRLTEILMTCTKSKNDLNSALDNISKYITARYADILSVIKTKSERSDAVYSVLSQYHKYVNDINSLEEITRLVIEDIDRASWSLKLAVQTLELTHRSEKNL